MYIEEEKAVERQAQKSFFFCIRCRVPNQIELFIHQCRRRRHRRLFYSIV